MLMVCVCACVRAFVSQSTDYQGAPGRDGRDLTGTRTVWVDGSGGRNSEQRALDRADARDERELLNMVVRKSKEEAEHVKGQLLGALDNVKRALQSQMEQIQKRMMKVVVPKTEFDSSINQLSKRFADVEWNILRPNPEVLDSGYRKKFHLAQFMDPTGPFLNETRHPAYSQRDESLKPKQGLEGAVFASERPRGFARTVGEAIPQSVFETKEMRASYTQVTYFS